MNNHTFHNIISRFYTQLHQQLCIESSNILVGEHGDYTRATGAKNTNF